MTGMLKKLTTDMVFENAPGEIGSQWHNLCVLENQLAELLACKPLGTQAIVGSDVWFLEEDDEQLVLMHATLHDGQLWEQSSRFDISLEWVDIEASDLQAYNEMLMTAIDTFGGGEIPSSASLERNAATEQNAQGVALAQQAVRNRIDAAVQMAESAFWSAIAERFPEAKSGDLPPMTVVQLNMHMKAAVKHWVVSNTTLEVSDSE